MKQEEILREVSEPRRYIRSMKSQHHHRRTRTRAAAAKVIATYYSHTGTTTSAD